MNSSGWNARPSGLTANDAPSAPSVNRPQYNREVGKRVPVLQVNNSVDVDDDTLIYEFEVDRVSTFSSNQKQSGAVTPYEANTASWSPSELKDNTVYYWRARACGASLVCSPESRS